MNAQLNMILVRTKVNKHTHTPFVCPKTYKLLIFFLNFKNIKNHPISLWGQFFNFANIAVFTHELNTIKNYFGTLFGSE